MMMMTMMYMARVIDVSMDFLALTDISLYFQLHIDLLKDSLMLNLLFLCLPIYIYGFIKIYFKNIKILFFFYLFSLIWNIYILNFIDECLLPY